MKFVSSTNFLCVYPTCDDSTNEPLRDLLTDARLDVLIGGSFFVITPFLLVGGNSLSRKEHCLNESFVFDLPWTFKLSFCFVISSWPFFDFVDFLLELKTCSSCGCGDPEDDGVG